MNIRRLVAPIATVLVLGGLAAAVPSPAHAATSVTVRVNGVQTYGGSPTFTAYTGVSGVTVSGVTCTGLTGDTPIAPTLAALGTYTIDGATCSGGVLSDPGYVITRYVGLRHTVNRAPLTVTADNRTREFRDPNPPLTATVTGFQNGEDASLLTGAPTLTTTAKPESQVGSYYSISVSAGSLSAGGNYVLRPFVAGKMTITPKSVTVAVTGAQVYGDAMPKFSGTTGFDGIYAGGMTCSRLADGRDIAPTLPVATNLAIDPSSCSGGTLSGRNYQIVRYSSVKFNVLKAGLTVTATNRSRTYGDANPDLTYVVSGLRNGEDTSVLSGQPALTTTADVTSNVGTYPIDAEAGTLSSPNYHFTYVDGTLTVGKAVLTVAADPASREFGAPDPVYTASYSGFRNGDTGASLGGAPSFSTTATASSNPGSYPLTVSAGTLSSGNYSFAGFSSSALTITQTDPVIVTKKMNNGVLEASVTYGAAGRPVVGSTVTFTVGVGSTVACTAVTDSAGKASCTVTSFTSKTAITLGGYTAHFGGTAGVRAGDQYQGILL